jgi:hypothetical protein
VPTNLWMEAERNPQVVIYGIIDVMVHVVVAPVIASVWSPWVGMDGGDEPSCPVLELELVVVPPPGLQRCESHCNGRGCRDA